MNYVFYVLCFKKNAGPAVWRTDGGGLERKKESCEGAPALVWVKGQWLVSSGDRGEQMGMGEMVVQVALAGLSVGVILCSS